MEILAVVMVLVRVLVMAHARATGRGARGRAIVDGGLGHEEEDASAGERPGEAGASGAGV